MQRISGGKLRHLPGPEELWELAGHKGSVHQQSWPTWDDELARDEIVQVAIQVDGKLREVIQMPVGASQAEVEAEAFRQPRVQQHPAERAIHKVIYVPEKILNIVTRRQN